MSEPIRILQVIGIMNLGGAENLIMNIYRNIDRSLVQFDFVENSEEEGYFEKEIISLGGKIYHCPHYTGKNHFVYRKWWNDFFVKHAKEYKAVHGHIGSTAAIYLSIAKKHYLYTIAHSHNTHHNSLKGVIYRIISYPTRWIADYFFACSIEAGIDRFGLRVVRNKKKYSILRNAIDTERFMFDPIIREQMRKQLNISNKKVLGHIGRFVKQKNQTLIVDIFKALKDKDSSYMLLMIGTGYLRNGIIEKIHTLGLEKDAIIMEPTEEIEKYYQAMDFFVFPSLYEGLGMVMLEAQCSGLRCVASDMVSHECVVTKNQVEFLPLSTSSEQWADHIVKRINYMRHDSHLEVSQNGYDIKNNAKIMQEFYLGIKDRR